VPKKYEDFLGPKWKGNFALDMDPDKSIMGWFKTWGLERTKKYMQGISKNEVVVRKGHTLLAQLLCAGEFKAAIDLYAYLLADLKHTRGCPVEISYPDPTLRLRARSPSSKRRRVLTPPPCCSTIFFPSRRKEFLPKAAEFPRGAEFVRGIPISTSRERASKSYC